MVSSCTGCTATILFGGVIDNEGRCFCSVFCKTSTEEKKAASIVRSTNSSLFSQETVIYCWPYCPANEGKAQPGAAKHNDPVLIVVSTFGLIWLLAWAMTYHLNFCSQTFALLKIIPFVFLPILSLFRGLTHIRVDYCGITLESAAGKSLLKSKKIPWGLVRKIYVEHSKPAKPLSGRLVIEHATVTRIPLEKIASAEQWKKLVAAIDSNFDSRLDSSLLDDLVHAPAGDPSYTRLWLDALTAPPRRALLKPLIAGSALQNGKYIVETLIGHGGQGSAYLATMSCSQKVVLKEYILPVYVDVRVRKQAIEEFKKEARLLTSLRHDGIVKCLASFVEDHRAYLVLEYIRGKSLRDLTIERKQLPELACINYAIDMAHILHYLHSQSPSIVHRDFTPDNVLVCADTGRLKLIDFMVAQTEDSQVGTVVGKQHYTPPEQFRGQATTASDLYALGCTMHYILTGEDPEPMTPSRPILKVGAISPETDRIVSRLTALEPKLRYTDSRTLICDLRSVQSRINVAVSEKDSRQHTSFRIS